MKKATTQDNIFDQFKLTEVELIYRNKTKVQDRPKIKGPECAYQLLLQSWNLNKIELVEEFKILLLDRAHTCLGIASIASGPITGCPIDPKIIFATALKARATTLILAHNHPSGHLEPSQADMALTKKIIAGGQLLEIAVPDHLIVTPHAYYSMADHGLM